jgi:hypothetical protein
VTLASLVRTAEVVSVVDTVEAVGIVVVDTSVAAIAILVAAALVVATAVVVAGPIVVDWMVVDHKVVAVADEVLIEAGVRLQRHYHGFHHRAIATQDE